MESWPYWICSDSSFVHDSVTCIGPHLVTWSYNIFGYILQTSPVFTFSNQAGLDMLETTLAALQNTTLEKIFDDHGRKILNSEFPQIMQQVSCFSLSMLNKEWSKCYTLRYVTSIMNDM